MKKINISIKHHLLIGVLISIWLFIFIFFIRPFDDGSISFQLWLFMGVGFSLIAFLCYGFLSVIQKSVYQKILKWNTSFEIVSLIFFYLFFLVSGFIYYKSPFINGGYDFFEFLKILFLKTVLILTPLIILARRYSINLIPIKEDYIIIRGENKHDILKIKRCHLVCISKAQNYVEIFFINGDQLEIRLIRSSLKKIQVDLNFLIKVHRSHLINPSHFKAWKNPNTIFLTQMEIPISKNYREIILSI